MYRGVVCIVVESRSVVNREVSEVRNDMFFVLCCAVLCVCEDRGEGDGEWV